MFLEYFMVYYKTTDHRQAADHQQPTSVKISLVESSSWWSTDSVSRCVGGEPVGELVVGGCWVGGGPVGESLVGDRLTVDNLLCVGGRLTVTCQWSVVL